MNDDAAALPERTSKSAAAFRTISEVAEELDVAQHVLRFWESKFTQVRPLKRGGGRRYYRPEDVALLREIRSLLYQEGYTIKGAQKLLRQKRTQAGPAEIESVPDDGGKLPADAAGPAQSGGESASDSIESAAPERDQAASKKNAKLRVLRDDLAELRDRLRVAMDD